MLQVIINEKDCNSKQGIQKLVQLVNDLQTQLYSSVYKTKLSGLSAQISVTKHKLNYIKGYLVISPSGDIVQVAFRILSDQSVQINSNIDMQGSTLILY